METRAPTSRPSVAIAERGGGRDAHKHTNTHTLIHYIYIYIHVRFGPSQLSCLGSSVSHPLSGRALCLECRVSWVPVPPEAAHFS